MAKTEIKNMLWGELEYLEVGNKDEPPIEDDRVHLTANIRLSKKYHPKHFQLRLTDENGEQRLIEATVSSQTDSGKRPKKKQFIQFRADDLLCNANYGCEILYKNKVLPVQPHSNLPTEDLYITTPPARQDPQPLHFAVAGDQERMQQFGFIGKLLGLDNYRQTKALFQHIAGVKQRYQAFFHLGDMVNGEYSFNPTNAFRSGRKVFELNVKTVNASHYHMKTDFFKPTRNAFAHMGAGVAVVVGDHDAGKNNIAAPKNKKERQARKAIQDALHESILLPEFLTQEDDGYGPVRTEGGRPGPYYKKRIGQSEFCILHNNYTNKKDAPADSYLLGEEQWAWLEQSLASSKASNKVIISPLPFIMGKDPDSDYRGHWQEWHQLMQLCLKYQVGTIYTADSHDLSDGEIHVRSYPEQKPWVVRHQLIGTLGGPTQSITDEERASISGPERAPLLPKGEGFDASLYEGSNVISYFSPGERTAFLPEFDIDEWGRKYLGSRWTTEEEWEKHTLGYAGILFTPLPLNMDIAPPGAESEKDVSMDYSSDFAHTMPWEVKSCIFTCNRSNTKVIQETRLDGEYTVGKSITV